MLEIPAGFWNGLSVVGVAVIVMMLMFRGVLVPRYFLSILKDTYEARLKDKDERIKVLEKSNAVLESTIQLQFDQLKSLSASTSTTRQVLESLKQVADSSTGAREAA